MQDKRLLYSILFRVLVIILISAFYYRKKVIQLAADKIESSTKPNCPKNFLPQLPPFTVEQQLRNDIHKESQNWLNREWDSLQKMNQICPRIFNDLQQAVEYSESYTVHLRGGFYSLLYWKNCPEEQLEKRFVEQFHKYNYTREYQ